MKTIIHSFNHSFIHSKKSIHSFLDHSVLDVLDMEGKLDALTKMTTTAEPLHWPNVDEVRIGSIFL